MSTDEFGATDQLIARLTAEAEPVRRLRHPLVRAGLWLAGVAAGLGIMIAGFADIVEFMARAQDLRQKTELIATVSTGILAVLAAFELSLPDRSRFWILLPIPALGLWLATSGLGCLQNWLAGAPTDLAESAECFLILIGASIPMGCVLLWMLRRAKPMAPTPVAAMGGLGIAAIAAFLLQFFHFFDMTIIDLAIHAVAVGIVVGVSTLLNRVTLA